MKINENTNVALPIRNLLAIIGTVAYKKAHKEMDRLQKYQNAQKK